MRVNGSIESPFLTDHRTLGPVEVSQQSVEGSREKQHVLAMRALAAISVIVEEHYQMEEEAGKGLAARAIKWIVPKGFQTDLSREKAGVEAILSEVRLCLDSQEGEGMATLEGAFKLLAGGHPFHSSLIKKIMSFGSGAVREIVYASKITDDQERGGMLLSTATINLAANNKMYASALAVLELERDNSKVAARIEDAIAGMSGKGGLGVKAFELARDFLSDTTSPIAIASFMVGGLVYKATKLAALTRFGKIGLLKEAALTKKLVAEGIGVAAEAPAFVLTKRGLSSFVQDPAKVWKPGDVARDVGAMLILFGPLKGALAMNKAGARALHEFKLLTNNGELNTLGTFINQFLSTSTLVSSLMAGDQAGRVFVWHQPPQESMAEAVLENLVTLAQVSIGYRLGNRLTGGRYERVAGELELKRIILEHPDLVPRPVRVSANGGPTLVGEILPARTKHLAFSMSPRGKPPLTGTSVSSYEWTPSRPPEKSPAAGNAAPTTAPAKLPRSWLPWEKNTVINQKYHLFLREVRAVIKEVYQKYGEFYERNPDREKIKIMEDAISVTLSLDDSKFRNTLNTYDISETALYAFMAECIRAEVKYLQGMAQTEQVRSTIKHRGRHWYPRVAEIMQEAIKSGATTREKLVKETGYSRSMIDQVIQGRANIPEEAIPGFAELIRYPESKLRRIVKSYHIRLPRAKRKKMLKEIGMKLRERRENLGKTRGDIENQLGLPNEVLEAIELGRKCSLLRFSALLEELGFAPKEKKGLLEKFVKAGGDRPDFMIERPYKELGDLISGIRIELKLGKHEMADRLRIRYVLYCSIENGGHTFPEHAIEKLARVAEMDPNQLKAKIGSYRKIAFKTDVPYPFKEAGDLLKKTMEEKRLDIETVAKSLKLSVSTFERILRGVLNPSSRKIDRFEEVLGIPKGKLRNAVLKVFKNPPYAKFGSQIRDARLKKGLQLENLAHEVHITSFQLSQIEKGLFLPKPGKIGLLEEKLETKLELPTIP